MNSGMVATDQGTPEMATVAQRWLARLALVAAAAAVLVAPVVAGLRQSIALVLVGLAGTRNHFALDLGLDRDDPSRCLVRGTQSRGLTKLAGREVVIDSDAAQIPVGVDGEALVLDTPVRCVVQPASLRVRVPRERPGVPDPKPIMDWKRLRRMALIVPGPGRG